MRDGDDGAEKQTDHVTLGPDGVHHLTDGGELEGRTAQEHGQRHGRDGAREKARKAAARKEGPAKARAAAVAKLVAKDKK